MMILEGYRFDEIVYEDMSKMIVRGNRLTDQKPVLVKLLMNEYPTSNEINRIKNEIFIAKSLWMKGILRVLGTENYKNGLALVMEDTEGQFLHTNLKLKEVSLERFLHIALQLTNLCVQLHQQRIIHCDIKPQHILIHPETDQIKLTGFGLAIHQTDQNERLDTENLVASFEYMSPEQTGRMHRKVDHRTDLYSLGILFYQMLSGRLPFQEKEPVEWIYAHIAKRPMDLHHKNRNIPIILSDVVMKLVAKNPEDRYQSAYGVRCDLETLLDMLKETGQLVPFTLAESDLSYSLQIPKKLYGRESEFSALQQAMERVQQGATELFLIIGESGVGKTALVHHFRSFYQQQKGYFISGKTDLLKGNIPYDPLIQSFRELIRIILTENSEQVSEWKNKLIEGIGLNGQVLIDVIPELEWIIGPQNPVQEVPPNEKDNRFQTMFTNFVQVIATSEHPLTIFIDDLQWADSATLKLLSYILNNVQNRSLLVIGACRRNEVQHRPLLHFLEKMNEGPVTVHRLLLKPFNLIQITQCIMDTFSCGEGQATPMAEMILQKTAGNPFFVTQSLLALYKEKMVRFELKEGKWLWSIDEINGLEISKNVIDLMVKSIRDVSNDTQQALKLAACIGRQFDLETLQTIDPKIKKEDIAVALEAGHIAPIVAEHYPYYEFIHDNVQQTVYSLLEEAEKQSYHLSIGRHWIEQEKNLEKSDKLFDIAHQLQLGIGQIKLPEEKRNASNLFLLAGKKAKSATAYDQALNYFNTGISLLPEDSWENAYQITFSFYLEKGECEYISCQFEQSERTFNLVLEKARTVREIVEVYNLKIMLYRYEGKYREAVDTGIFGLQLLGVKLSSAPSKLTVLFEILTTKWLLLNKQVQCLGKLPRMENIEKELILHVLTNLGSSSFQINQDLLGLQLLKMMNITLKYGNTEVSPLIYCNYGLILCTGFENYKKGYEFGRLGVELANKSTNIYQNGNTYFVFSCFINHWQCHIGTSIDILKKASWCAMESGNLEIAAAATSFLNTIMLNKGDAIDEIIKQAKKDLVFVEQIKNTLMEGYLRFLIDMLLILKESKKDPMQALKRIPLEETNIVDPPSLIFYNTLKLMMFYLFEQYDEALQIAHALENIIDGKLALLNTPDFLLYYSLTLAQVYPTSNRSEQKRIWKLLVRYKKKMGKWAKHSPENYLHKYHLITAEMKRITGKEQEANELFDLAILEAQRGRFQHLAALANELTAKNYFFKNKRKIAEVYLKDAIHGYMLWGAEAKADHLHQKYADILRRRNINTSQYLEGSSSLLSTIEHVSNVIDMTAILKASQTISSEIVLEKLLNKLMLIVLRSAGAQKGVLLLEKNGSLYVEAEGKIVEDKVENERTKKGRSEKNRTEEKRAEENRIEVIQVLQSTPIEKSDSLSKAIVHYVYRTNELIVLVNATQEGLFTKDQYVLQNQPKSIMCLPVVNQGRLVGILYLENNIASHSFTSKQLDVLKIIVAQAAISIEHARLYSSLEEKVTERTVALEKSNLALENKNKELSRMEESRRQLLTNISHDLRTPITSIRGFIEAIQDGVVEGGHQSKYMKIIHQKTLGLNRLIEDLFQLSKLESKQISIEMKEIEVEELITMLYMKYELDVKEAGLVFNKALPRSIGRVLVDVDRIDQVFSNLVYNSIKHTPKAGEISIHVEVVTNKQRTLGKVQEEVQKEVQKEVHKKEKKGNQIKNQIENQNVVLIKIIDSGIGISTEDLPYVFDRFYRGTKSRNTSTGGSGLGLAIVKEIVQHHGGEVWVESQHGQGSTFCFTLPLVC